MSDIVRCRNADCAAAVEYWQYVCAVCGTPHSYPNVRKAEQERNTLLQFYQAAMTASATRGAIEKVRLLETAVLDGEIIVSAPLDFVYNLISDPRTNFTNYHRLVDAGVRKAAREQYHIDRKVADHVLFPQYDDHIVQGALSCDGVGLPNYGAIGMVLKEAVAPLRVSLLIENSFRFLAKHFRYRKPLPAGYRSTWDDRGRLSVVKHASDVSIAMPNAELAHLVIRRNDDRETDDFMEVHIYDLFDKQAIKRIVLNEPLVERGDQNRWQELKEILVAEQIDFDEEGTGRE